MGRVLHETQHLTTRSKVLGLARRALDPTYRCLFTGWVCSAKMLQPHESNRPGWVCSAKMPQPHDVKQTRLGLFGQHAPTSRRQADPVGFVRPKCSDLRTSNSRCLQRGRRATGRIGAGLVRSHDFKELLVERGCRFIAWLQYGFNTLIRDVAWHFCAVVRRARPPAFRQKKRAQARALVSCGYKRPRCQTAQPTLRRPAE